MSTRHYFSIKKGNETVFEEQILGNHDFFDDKFYKNINIKFNEELECVELQEINLADFFVEWINFLERNPEKNGVSISNLLKCKDKFIQYQNLIDANYYCLQPFMLLRDIKEYIYQINESSFNNYGKLKEGYKAYIEAF